MSMRCNTMPERMSMIIMRMENLRFNSWTSTYLLISCTKSVQFDTSSIDGDNVSIYPQRHEHFLSPKHFYSLTLFIHSREMSFFLCEYMWNCKHQLRW